MLWQSDIAHIAELREESRIWQARAAHARWEYDAIGFSGYVSQWIRWKRYAAELDKQAREIMGVDGAQGVEYE